MSEKCSVRALVEAVAGPRSWSDTRQSWLNRAARRSGLTYRTIKSIWYGEIADENHNAVRLLRATAEDASPKALALRFEKVARAMESTDADFHREDIAALVHAARALRGVAGPRDDST